MKKIKLLKNLSFISVLTLLLNACGTFFDKDNTPPPAPLVDFISEAKVHSMWYTSAGAGSNSDYLKLTPSASETAIFTSSKNGVVAANDAKTGKSLWQTNTGGDISSGTATYAGLVYAGSREGDVYALDQNNGKIVWKAKSSSEVLAPVAISDNIVLVKTIDGHVRAFSTLDGHELWKYQQPEPNLILRGSSAPQITRESAVVGFENGNLVKLTLHGGRVQWQRSIAEPQGIFAIQRMIDIDADPIIQGNRVYAATYQGRIAALNVSSGNELWSHDISSYSGMASDDNSVYVSDADSHVFAFNANGGTVRWQQPKLYARTITGPVLIDNYVVVGDAEGYLHWMSKIDGRFVARVRVNKSGIAATPIVSNHVLYAYSKDGHLAAYTVSSR
ncbi:MAG TPA: outer membrane protein assembly factor BamB [Gammaproteobacteria bacterium]|nr:outer membrane protein assembly factor BamB [Gammaproteobacteria bacterium]